MCLLLQGGKAYFASGQVLATQKATLELTR